MLGKARDTEKAILEQLDVCAKAFEFPVLDNLHFRIGDARLSAFKGDEWLIVFELLVYDVRASVFVNMLYAYGEGLSHQGYQTSVTIFTEPQAQPYADEDGNILVDLSDFNVVIHGEARRFTPTERDYIQVGVLPEMQMEPEAKLLRYVCSTLRPQLFLSLSDLCRHLSRTQMPRLIELYEWSHPDIAGNELPSENECIRRLARVLAQSNPNHYQCPANLINSHWSNWLTPPLW